jgi:hypothetical protein
VPDDEAPLSDPIDAPASPDLDTVILTRGSTRRDGDGPARDVRVRDRGHPGAPVNVTGRPPA